VISITSAQLDYWLALFAYPMARILGMVSTAPVFSNAGIPAQIRLTIGLAIGLGMAPALPPMPEISVGTWAGLGIMVQQTLIGFIMGFTISLAFAAINIAGELIGLQMGLSFAVFYDPNSKGQTPVLTNFLALFAALVFLSMNGHLVTLSALAESFTLLPVSATPFAAKGLAAVFSAASIIFASGLMLALPIIAALLITNIALAVLSRVAPTLNLFAIGFPVTMTTGFAVLALTLPQMGNAFMGLYERGFSALDTVLRAGAASP
jgi:flagellar biosynthetic protein FliR